MIELIDVFGVEDEGEQAGAHVGSDAFFGKFGLGETHQIIEVIGDCKNSIKLGTKRMKIDAIK